MIDVREIPVIGRAVVSIGAFADLLLHSGEWVFLVVDFLLANIGILIPLIRYSESLANRVAWLPAPAFDQVVTFALAVLVTIEIARLGSKAVSKL